PFVGDLDDYAKWLNTRELNPGSGSGKGKNKGGKSAPAAANADIDPALLAKPIRENIKRLDTQMAKLQKDLAALDVKLADPALYDEKRKWDFKMLQKEHAEVSKKLAAAEAEWLKASEQLEALGV
ncbi:MAG: hypothetical protein K2X34_03300, partial [Hyphomonadaceae bacterium]|nr:hypothetical protein [Hyphomonadaceae bacterium]